MATTLEQTLVSKFHAAKNTFDAAWKTGAYEWLHNNAIGRMVTIVLTEEHLDAVWAKARAGQAPVSEFEAALEKWKQAHVDGLQEFNVRSGQ